jgi:membrane-associated phospholipid phosphatase
VLVAAGAFARLDTYAVRHWMPWLTPGQQTSSLLDDVLPYHGGQSFRVADVVLLPAALLPASALMALLAFVLWRRGRFTSAAAALVAFGSANCVEFLCKKTLARPRIWAVFHDRLVDVPGFNQSFPSGHTIRALLVVATAALLWPRARSLFVAWGAAVVVALELDGRHTPSDLLGGVLLACVAASLIAATASGPVEGRRRRAGVRQMNEPAPARR